MTIVCEVCGRTEEEEAEESGSDPAMPALHLCDSCREDRQSSVAADGE